NGTKFGIAEVPLAGGMEHPTCISIGSGYIPNGTTYEWLYAHETVHMWYGDSVGLGTWMDFWLSEGFASYGDALWKEEHYGDSAFQSRMNQFKNQYFGEDNGNRFPVYNPDVMLSATVYNKGAWVVHMLRHLCDTDDDFFDMLADYYAIYAHGAAITQNLEDEAEVYYGGALDWFFDEWLVMAGYPEYEYVWGETKNRGKATAHIELEQVQEIDSETPVFEMPIDFLVTTTDDTELITVWNDQQTQTFDVPLSITGSITGVELDPDNWLLCTEEDTTDVEMISFTAEAHRGGIVLNWDVEEDGNLKGYNLYRRDISGAESGSTGEILDNLKPTSTKINRELITGTPPYSYFDDSANPSRVYEYKLEAVYSDSNDELGTCRNSPANPYAFALYPAYPNPARGEVTFSFSLPEPTKVTLDLFDIRGRKVAALLDEKRQPGTHKVNYIATLANGIYLYRLETEDNAATGKMVISR
ncbi:MAG: T9SS type A sorting domain-containing protein, partial [bacterium]|nr:T9SS type A sorting domain-containing protein [bacterium]